MINPSFQDLSKVSKSRYEVAVMVMQRASLLIEGSKPLVASEGAKPVTVALDEIMAGKIKAVAPEEEEVPVSAAEGHSGASGEEAEDKDNEEEGREE